jgi:hypothetical protein
MGGQAKQQTWLAFHENKKERGGIDKSVAAYVLRPSPEADAP